MPRTPKHVKEAFFKGHSGTSHAEVASLVLCLPLFMVLGELIMTWTGVLQDEHPATYDKRHRRLLSAACEIVLVWVPQVLLYTDVLPPVPTCIILLVVLISLAIIRLMQTIPSSTGAAGLTNTHSHQTDIIQRHDSRTSQGNNQDDLRLREALENMTGHRRRYMGAFRGGLMLGTCICILAVDFRVFPRRYAKSEVWGTSLMDVGVGGVVLAGGLTANRRQQVSTANSKKQASMLSQLVQGIKGAAMCWLLWAVRLLSVRALDYQEAVGEYGVHWNFFLTVAFITLARHLTPTGLSYMGKTMLTLITLIGHQLAQSAAGFGEWARSDVRDDHSLFSLNKEGLVSLFGYWILDLAGQLIGSGMTNMMMTPAKEALIKLDTAHTRGSKGGLYRWQVLRPMMTMVGGWVVVDVLLWVMLGVLEVWVEPVCRRSANASYVVWVCALSVAVLLVLLVAQLLLPGGLRPVVPGVASSQMLVVFLMANLMTGGVNVVIDTLQVTDEWARMVLMGYVCVLCAAVAWLDCADINIRLR